MRIAIALLTCLFVLAACSGEDGAAKAQQIKQLKQQYTQLNAELAEKLNTWGPIRDKVIPAMGAWRRAKASGDEGAAAAAKLALEEAQAASNDAIALEKSLKDRIRDLKDKIRKLGGKL